MGNIHDMIIKAVSNKKVYKFGEYDVGCTDRNIFFINHYGKTIFSIDLATGNAVTQGTHHADKATIHKSLKVLGFNAPTISSDLMNKRVAFGQSQNKWW